MVDCEQSLIFLCKVTARQPKHASRDKRGRKPEKEKKRLLTLLFCLGTTKLVNRKNLKRILKLCNTAESAVLQSLRIGGTPSQRVLSFGASIFGVKMGMDFAH